MKLFKVTLVLALLFVSNSAFAFKWQINEESSINLAVLLQPQYQTSEDMAPSGDGWSNDFFLRRARVMVFGNVTNDLSFFLDTDQINYGKNGDWATQFYIQDAFMALKVVEEFQIAGGLILLPFTRHNFQGATGLNGLDYHGTLVKFPGGSHKVWRDVGVQFYGWALDDRLHYRAGVFGGSQNALLVASTDTSPEVRSNPDDLPRFTGHVRYNIMGKEKDFFAKGIYFSKEPIISVGVGADFVPDSVLSKAHTLTTKPEYQAHLGVAGDVFVEFPLNEDNEILFQGTFVYYDDGEKAAGTGTGFLVEAGYRWKSIEPVIGFDSFSSDAEMKDYQAIKLGVNFWGNKHGFNLKGEFALVKDGDPDADYMKQFTLQGQFLF